MAQSWFDAPARRVLVVAWAGSLVMFGCTPNSRDGAPRSGGTTEPPVSNVALVTCDRAGTHVLTPRVRPQRDGVHFRVDNRLGTAASFSARGPGGGMGNGAPPGISEPEGDGQRGGWSVAPGAAQVRCLDQRADGGSPGWQPITVVDPDGLYVSDVIDCNGGGAVTANRDYTSDAAGLQGDPTELARAHFTGVRPTDVARRAGYPEQSATMVSIVRAGRVIATAELERAGAGGWLIGTTNFCSADLRSG